MLLAKFATRSNIMKSDYLKYWRVVQRFYLKKYDITPTDLDMLLFLYSEGQFTTEKFEEYRMIMPWDDRRFSRVKEKGWIVVWRERMGKHRAIYELSPQAKRMISQLYKHLEGEELPMSPGDNPFNRGSAGWTDRQHLKFLKKAREATRQRQRRSRE